MLQPRNILLCAFLCLTALHLCASSAEAQSTARAQAWTKLLSYRDRDMRALNAETIREIEAAARVLIPERNGAGRSCSDCRPWFFWRIQHPPGQTRYILFDGQPLYMIPGASRARVSVFEPDGQLLSSSAFSTGWRLHLEGAMLSSENPLGVPLIVALTRPSINGSDVARQYYAIIEDKVALLRFESSSGRLLRNPYAAPNLAIGPPLPQRSPEEWARALMSADPAQVLRALMWLGGRHLDPQRQLPPYMHQAPAESRLVTEIRSREDVRRRVETLKSSDNAWLREAAEFAANAVPWTELT